MTNQEKSELMKYAKNGKSFSEIRKLVTCSDQTIKKYIKVSNISRNEKEDIKLCLLSCPHCGAKAKLKIEGKFYTKRYGKKVEYARIVCENNKPYKDNRCLCKTVAAPINEVIKHWNERIKL